ncbi:MAG: WcaI family glycosyltransferase, partial [Thiogranum sp.]
MRILIYGINYYPELTGIGKYTGEMAQWLVENGCEVKVVAAPPYYPAWKVSAGYTGMAYRREELFGASVVRCPLWVPARPTGIKRILHLASFAISSFPVVVWNALVWRPDLVFLTEPPLLCVPGALVAAKFCGATSWLHIQDFEVDAAFDLGILKSPRSRRRIQSVERWFMKKFDRVSTISERMLDRLTGKGVMPERQLLFQNWIDMERIRPLEGSSLLRQELGIPDGVTVLLYSGGMGAKQGLELIVEAASRLRDRKELFFLLCGEGFVRAALEKSSQHLDNIRFVPLQPLDRLNELLNIADVHLLPQKPGAEDLV